MRHRRNIARWARVALEINRRGRTAPAVIGHPGRASAQARAMLICEVTGRENLARSLPISTLNRIFYEFTTMG
jgi:hypothetical protein